MPALSAASRTPRRVQLPLLATVVVLIVAAASVVGATWWKGQRTVAERAIALTGGDPGRGGEAVLRYGCGSCHTIPGVRGARGPVGPPLTGIANRVYLAGVLYNTPENMMLWVRAPRSVDPLTAMPDMGVSEADGRDIAAFLYTLN